MATQSSGLVLALVTMALWATMGSAQSSDCSTVLVSLSPCLNYITGNSSTPSPSCCSQLGSAVRAQPNCLCEVLNGGGSTMGLNINQTQALALPGACNVQTPPLSRCNGAGSPTGSPSSETPASDTPSGTGSKTVPTTDGGSSDGSSTKMSMSLLSFAVLAVAYASA